MSVMNLLRCGTVSGTALVLAACTTFDPYVLHNPAPPKPSKASRSECQAASGDKAELVHACRVLESMEAARSEHARVQSGMVASLVPLAGLVGYKAARGGSSANTAALATAGLAGYTVGGTLAQPARLKVYDAGITSVSCAIGVYERALHTDVAPPASALAVSLDLVATRVLNDIDATLSLKESRDNPGLQDSLDMLRVYIESLKSASIQKDPTSLLRAQLKDSVNTTVDKINDLLSNTIPTSNAALGSSFGLLSSSANAPAREKEKEATVETADVLTSAVVNSTAISGRSFSSSQAGFVSRLNSNALLMARLYGLLIDQTGQTPQLTANFSVCNMRTMTAAVELPYSMLALGAGDSMNNQTVTVTRGSTQKIPLFGGVPPYAAVIYSGPAVRPTVGIDVDGTGKASLSIYVDTNQFKDSKEQLDYVAMVSDAVGRDAKQIRITVPASAKTP